MDNADKPEIIGYTTYKVEDNAGRLLLAEGAPVTLSMLERLKERGLMVTLADKPRGANSTQSLYNSQLPQKFLKLPERLDAKFDKLDLITVENASQCIRTVLGKVAMDTFLRDNISVLAQRFSEVYSHSINVCMLADIIAQKVNLSPSDRQALGLAALFHDIGKLLLPPKILREANENAETKLYYRQYPRLGADILLAGKKGLDAVALVVKQHHEQCSGQGYPDGLTESEIHPHAHIIRVADVFDRITSTCFQEDALSPVKAIEYIVEAKGTGFHPAVVDRFIEAFPADI